MATKHNTVCIMGYFKCERCQSTVSNNVNIQSSTEDKTVNIYQFCDINKITPKMKPKASSTIFSQKFTKIMIREISRFQQLF